MHHPDQVRIFTHLLVALSFLATIFAIYGYYGADIWLASTQWIIVAILLGVWAIFFSKNLNK